MAQKNAKVVVINDLDVGGAQRVLYQLIRNTQSEVYLYSFIGGSLSKDFALITERLIVLELVGWKNFLRSLFNDLNDCKKCSSWLYKSDLVVGLLRTIIKFEWTVNLRNGNIDLYSGTRSRLYLNCCSFLTNLFSNSQISNNEYTLALHAKLGYRLHNHRILYNPVPESMQSFNVEDRFTTREQLGINHKEIVIGYPARLAKGKNWDLFLSVVTRASRKITLLLNTDSYEMLSTKKNSNLRLVLWDGVFDSNYYSVLDIVLFTSDAESYSNAVIEASMSGLPILSQRLEFISIEEGLYTNVTIVDSKFPLDWLQTFNLQLDSYNFSTFTRSNMSVDFKNRYFELYGRDTYVNLD